MAHMMGQNGGGGMDTVISSLITNYILKKLELDMNYMALVFPISIGLVTMLRSEFDMDYLKSYTKSITVYHLMFSAICYVVYTKHQEIRRYLTKKTHKDVKPTEKEHITINIYEKNWIGHLIAYMKMYPQMFDAKCNIDVGNPLFINILMDPTNTQYEQNSSSTFMLEAQRISETANQRIEFNDTNLGQKGYIMWKYFDAKDLVTSNGLKKSTNEVKDKENDKSQISRDLKYKYLEINFEKDSLDDPKNYLNKVKEYVTASLDKNRIVLYHSMVYLKTERHYENCVDYKSSVYYDGTKLLINDAKTQLIDSFFHPMKKQIWEEVLRVHTNPGFYDQRGQTARFSCILHGQPGTGKSSLTYRIAKALGRHIISVDLGSLIERTKSEIYDIFRKPYVDGKPVKPNQCVFSLDEFDIGFLNLYARDQEIQKCRNSFENPVYSFNEEEGIKSTFSKGYKNTMTNFSLDDLKNVLQGATPIDGIIIFAATNKYKEITDKCPALFRVGR